MNRLRNFTGLLGAGLSIAVIMICGAAPAQASFTPREDALAAFTSVSADMEVDPGWTGSIDTCDVGTESQSSIDATLHTLNVIRAVAGIPPVTFSAAMDHAALASALMTRAGDAVSHEPDSSWPCYSKEGADAAATSNIYLGLSGASAMVGYIEDPGISSLGHRRWLLDPASTTFGSGSTGTTNALKVVEKSGKSTRRRNLPDDTLVAWPSPGWFPSPWMFKEWSVAIGSENTKVDVSSAKVSATIDGSPLPTSGLSKLPAGTGTGVTLGWSADMPAAATSGDHAIAIAITGVRVDGKPRPINYTVDAFDPTVAGQGTIDPGEGNSAGSGNAGNSGNGNACHLSKKKLKRARTALAKARRHHRKTGIKKARKNLRALSRAQTRRCG